MNNCGRPPHWSAAAAGANCPSATSADCPAVPIAMNATTAAMSYTSVPPASAASSANWKNGNNACRWFM